MLIKMIIKNIRQMLVELESPSEASEESQERIVLNPDDMTIITDRFIITVKNRA